MDLSGLTWRKSSHSGSNGTDCVEVTVVAEAAAVRDSKNPEGAVLAFAAPHWARFLAVARGR